MQIKAILIYGCKCNAHIITTGYMNNTQVFEHIGEFHQGVAVFNRNGLYGVILMGGNVIIQPQYDYISKFNNGYADAIREGFCVIIDLSGKEYKRCDNHLVPLHIKYEFVKDFQDGLACVKKDGKWGVIDNTGRELIPTTYDYISDFQHGAARGIKEIQPRNYANQWDLLNYKGDILNLGYVYPEIANDGTIYVRKTKLNYLADHDEELYIRVDCTGHVVLKKGNHNIILDKTYNDYYVANDYIENIARVQETNGNWGALNYNGDVFIPFVYKYLSNFHEGRAFAIDGNNKTCILDLKGKVIKILDNISSWNDFYNGCAIVYHGEMAENYRSWSGNVGIVNLQGEYVVNLFQGRITRSDKPEIFLLEQNKQFGIYNSLSNKVIRPSYEKILSIENDYIIVQLSGKNTFTIDYDGRPFVIGEDNLKIYLPSWCVGGKIIDNNEHYILGLSKDGKWGVVDKNENTIHQPRYNSITSLEDNFLQTTVVEKIPNRSWFNQGTVTRYGLISVATGVEILADYDCAPSWNGSFYIIQKNSLYGVIDVQGKLIHSPKFQQIKKNGNYYITTTRLSNSNQAYEFKSGLLDYDGQEIIDARYDKLEILKEEESDIIYKGKLSGVWMLYNKSGALNPNSYDQIQISDDGGSITFSIGDKTGKFNLSGNIIVHNDSKEEILIPAKYCWASDFHNGLATVLVNGHEQVIDENFQTIIICENKIIKPTQAFDYIKEHVENTMFIFAYNGKNGLLDHDGNIAIEAKYDNISPLSANLYIATTGKKSGVINANDETIIPLEYTDIVVIESDEMRQSNIFYFGVSKVLKQTYGDYKTTYESKYGLYDHKGNLIADCLFDKVLPLCNNGFFVKESGKWRITDKELNRLTEEDYVDVKQGKNGFYLVAKDTQCGATYQTGTQCFSVRGMLPSIGNRLWGVIDSSGKEKLPVIYCSIGEFETDKTPNGMAIITKANQRSHLYGLINDTYDIIAEPVYTSIYGTKDTYVFVKKEENNTCIYGKVDTNGKFYESSDNINDYYCGAATELDNGYTMVYMGEYRSIVDSKGRLLLPFKYCHIEPLSDGYFKIAIREAHNNLNLLTPALLYGILDPQLCEIISPQYRSISELSSSYIVFNGKYGAFDRSGTEILPCSYSKIVEATKNLLWIYQEDDRQIGIANLDGDILIHPKYGKVTNFINGYSEVLGDGHWYYDDDEREYSYNGGHWGIVNSDGIEIIPTRYETIKYDPNKDQFEVKYKTTSYYGKVFSGILDKQGNHIVKDSDGQLVIANAKCDWQEDYSDGYAKAYYKGYEGKINDGGHLIVSCRINGETTTVEVPDLYNWGFDSSTEYVICMKGDKRGVFHAIDKKVIIEPIYDDIEDIYISELSNSYFICRINREYTLIHNSGAVLLPLGFNIYYLGFSLFVVKKDRTNSVQLYDCSKQTMFDEEYSRVYKFGSNGDSWRYSDSIKNSEYAIFEKDNKFGLLNRFGDVVINSKYSAIKFVGNNILSLDGNIVDIDGYSAVENDHILIHLNEHYDSATLLDNSLIVVQRGDLYGCLNIFRKEIIPIKYHSLKGIDNLFIATYEDQTTVIDVMNNPLIPKDTYDDIKIIDRLLLFKKEYKWGAYTLDGKLLCKAQYDHICRLTDSLIKVGYDAVEYDVSTCGYHNQWGEYEEDYDVRERGIIRWGLINLLGQEVLPCTYRYINPGDVSGLYNICDSNGFVGLMDIVGNIILEPTYKEIQSFQDGYAIVRNTIEAYNRDDEKIERDAMGVIDCNFNEILPCRFASIEYDTNTKLFKTEIGFKTKDGRFISENSGRRVLVPSKYKYCKDFIDGAAIAVQQHSPGFSYGLIDERGVDIFPPIFRSINYVADGLYKFKINNLYGLFNKSGEIILHNKYSYIGKFEENIALTAIKETIDNKEYKLFGLIDINGQVIIPPMCEFIGNRINGYATICQCGKWGIINLRTHNIIFVNNVSYIGCLNDGLFRFNRDGVFDDKSHKVKGGKWGYINESGEIAIEAVYDDAKRFSEGLAPIKIDNRWGFINKDGEVIIPIEYNSVEREYTDGKCLVSDGSTNYCFNSKGILLSTTEVTYYHNDSDDYYEKEDYNYEEEAWYYLTGGQYGDYPGGDIDYSFMGL